VINDYIYDFRKGEIKAQEKRLHKQLNLHSMWCNNIVLGELILSLRVDQRIPKSTHYYLNYVQASIYHLRSFLHVLSGTGISPYKKSTGLWYNN